MSLNLITLLSYLIIEKVDCYGCEVQGHIIEKNILNTLKIYLMLKGLFIVNGVECLCKENSVTKKRMH